MKLSLHFYSQILLYETNYFIFFFITGNDLYDCAVRDLVQLSRNQRSREEIQLELERIMVVINQNQPKRPTKSTPTKKQYFPWLISEEHPVFVRYIYHFILTGNMRCFLSFPLSVELGLKDLDFLDKLLPIDDGKVGLEMISFLENIKDNSWCLLQPFMTIYAKCVFSEFDNVSEKAIKKFYIFCDIPKKLFLFMTISEKLLSASKTPEVVQSRSLASNIEKPLTDNELRMRRLARFNTTPNEQTTQLAESDKNDGNSMIAENKQKQKICSLNLDSEKLRKCFNTFLDCIEPELLLLFITQDKVNIKTEECGWLDFRYLLDHLNPELSENNKDTELKQLVIVFYSEGIDSFRKKADAYVEKSPFLGSSENVIFTCILEYISLRCTDLDNFIKKIKKCGKGSREEIKKDHMKYFEQEDEYSIKEDNYLYLTFKHIPQELLLEPQVFLSFNLL